jgi:hypothetical protein
VDWADRGLDVIPLGTGEGLERTFGTGVKDKALGYDVKRTRWRALFIAREVDQVAALMARKGATLSPTLRQVYSGEELGHANADPERRVVIGRHEYRACAIVGVQPGRGEALLGDADGGLPQRFLWLPTTDPGIPDEKPDDPAPIQWQPPAEIADLADNDLSLPRVMQVCDTAAATIDRARVWRMRGDGDALDGHSLYTRLKIGAALALYTGRFTVDDEDWELAGHLMTVSDHTRGRIAEALRRAEEARNDARGRAEARRTQIVSDATAQNQLQSTENRIMTVLRQQEGWLAHGRLRQQLSTAQRDCFPEAIERLLKDELIEVRSTAAGHGATGLEYAVHAD